MNEPYRYDDGSIRLDGEHVVLRLDHDSYEWLCDQVERSAPKDGATRNMLWYLYEHKKQLIKGWV